MKKPNLYIVGFQKCGSSSLYDMLCNHPEIIGTTPKETFYLSDIGDENYDNNKSIDNPEITWENYFSNFDAKYLLEASVNNFYQKRALKYISENGGKVIIIMRDPVDRFISNYKYYSTSIFKITGEIGPLEYYQKVKEGIFDRDCLRYSIEHGKYYSFIKIWQEALGNENVKLLSFKELIHNPENVFNDVCEFLLLEKIKIEDIKWKNESVKIRNLSTHNFLVNNFGKMKILKRLFRGIYLKIFTTKFELKVDESVKALIRKEYEVEYEHYKEYF